MIDPISIVTKFATSITPKGWLVVAAITLVVASVTAAVMIADNRDKRLAEVAKQGGASAAVVEGQRDILDQVERANNAEQEINRGGDAARYDRCLRNASADTRANCSRFRPVPD